MPLYDYRCNACNATTTVFTQSVFNQVDPVCAQCGGKDLARLVSSFAYHKSASTAAEESGPSPRFPTLDYYKDPRNIGRHVEDSFKKFGVEMPDSVKEQIQAAREGTVPKEVEL